MIDQMRVLRKAIPTFNAYAGMTIDKIFSSEELKNAYIGKAYTFSSCYFENNGQGIYTTRALPPEAQILQVNAILCDDFNQDGFTDALLAGNNYSLTPSKGRMDAGTGLLLAGDGKGAFKPVRSMHGGFFADKDAKSMVQLKMHGQQRAVIVRNNNDKLKFYKISTLRPSL